MARDVRAEEPGGFFTGHARKNEQPISFGNWSGRLILRLLEQAVGRHGWVPAYVEKGRGV